MSTEWGIKVTTVELKDIQLPDSMKRRGRQPRGTCTSATTVAKRLGADQMIQPSLTSNRQEPFHAS
jgi:regulator of protease activity HflC (stomatin/prohibitin superfamily)